MSYELMARLRSQLKVESGKLNVLCGFPSTLNSQLSTGRSPLNSQLGEAPSTLNSQLSTLNLNKET